MIGTLLIIIPTVITIVLFILHKVRRDHYNDGYAILSIITGFFSFLIIIFAIGVYANTSSYTAQRDSLQSTLDYARNNNSGQYEMATVTRDVMEFNRMLETNKNFWHNHFRLWINDDILELEPVK